MMRQRPSVRLIREKSKKLKIPYQNLLAAGAREWVLTCLFQEPTDVKILIKRTSQLGLRSYRTGAFKDLYLCVLNTEVTGEWLTGFLSDHLQETDFRVKERTDGYDVHLEVEFDRIRIPVVLHIQIQEEKKAPTVSFPLKLISENDKTLTLPCYYPELELAELFADYFSRLELYPDMAALETVYLYATGRNLNGKYVSLYLEEEFEKRNLALTEETRKQYEQSLYNKALQARFKGYLGSSKRKEPGFDDVHKILAALFDPVLEALLKEQIFFGDWICDVQRYL